MARENAFFTSGLSRPKGGKQENQIINSKRIFTKLLIELEEHYELLPQTIEWLEAWTKSPNARFFSSTDWNRLKMLTPLVDKYFKTSSHYILSEIRMNESLLGATLKDRKELIINTQKQRRVKEEIETIEIE